MNQNEAFFLGGKAPFLLLTCLFFGAKAGLGADLGIVLFQYDSDQRLIFPRGNPQEMRNRFSEYV